MSAQSPPSAVDSPLPYSEARLSHDDELERELRRRQILLEEAESIADIGSWEFNLATQEILWSKGTFRLFGMEVEERAPNFTDYLAMLHEDDRPALLAAVEETSRTGKPYKIEVRVIGRDGVVRRLEARGKRLLNERGEAVKLVGTARDITKYVLQAEALRETEFRLQSIVENIRAIIATFDLAGYISFISPAVETLLGYAPSDVLGKNFADFLHPDYQALAAELMMQALGGQNNGANLDAKMRTAGGEWTWLNIVTSLVRGTQGEPLYFVGIARDVAEQKAMQEKLQRSEESLAEAQRMAHLGSWYADVRTGKVELSNEMYKILGAARGSSTFSAKEFLAIVHPSDRIKVQEGLRRAVDYYELVQEEIRIVRSGSIRWLDVRVKPVIERDETVALYGTVWDITERKVTEQQIRALNLTLEERVQERTQQLEEANKRLRASQSNMRTLIESANDAIWSIDRAYRLTAMNAALYALIAVSNEFAAPAVGDSTLNLLPGASPDEWKNLYDRALAGEKFLHHLHYTVSDRAFDSEISFNPIFDEQRNVTGAVIYARDISSRLQAERELRQREEFLRLIFDAAPLALALTDAEGFFRRVNNEYARLSGYAVEELEGTSVGVAVPPEEREEFLRRYRELFSQEAKHNVGMTTLFCKSGSRIPIEFASSLFTAGSGEQLAITAITDVSLRLQAEDEIKRALEQERELGALKSRFVVMVSHEFRTPLTTIRASAELLERRGKALSTEKQTEYLRDIQKSVDEMSRLMEEILYLGKADAAGLDCVRAPVSIVSLYENIINGLEIIPGNEHRISAYIAGAMPPTLLLDERLLRHILTNLLSNALKYSPKETPVELRLEFLSGVAAESGPAPPSGSERASVGMMCISIQDFGIGIAEEDQKRLFEPFYRAGNVGAIPGTGLGLAIVKHAVEAHGGMIRCRSLLGVGTEFIVVIPCASAESAEYRA